MLTYLEPFYVIENIEKTNNDIEDFISDMKNIEKELLIASPLQIEDLVY